MTPPNQEPSAALSHQAERRPLHENPFSPPELGSLRAPVLHPRIEPDSNGTWVASARLALLPGDRDRPRGRSARAATDRCPASCLALLAGFLPWENLQAGRGVAREAHRTYPRSTRAPPSQSWRPAGPFATRGTHFNTKCLRRVLQGFEGPPGPDCKATPARSIFIGSNLAPSATMAASTRARASGSISNVTHPPPPAPQTFPASAPRRRAEEITRSTSGVEIVRRLRRRNSHSSRIRRPASPQSFRSSASRTARAMIEIFSRFRETRRSPSICRLNTSQLLMPCC